MAGVYIHIPFCKQACTYCNFHFSTSVQRKNALIDALVNEINLTTPFGTDTINTIYFGGGTPSLLSAAEFHSILNTLHKKFPISSETEITLEANPDDINTDHLQSWASMGINRLSIGIQSFFEEDLKWMNRAHNRQQALQCVPLAQDAGLHNITIDLIYGSPQLSDVKWETNVQTAINYQIPHLSCYALTVEPETPLGHWVKKKQHADMNQEQQSRQFLQLTHWMEMTGYEHYEVSNYAQPGFRSKHNSAYWKGTPYYGFGPSAHSYNGINTRSWNVANNALYIQALQKNQIPREDEVLTLQQQMNETVMTQLRLKEGINLSDFTAKFGEKETIRIQQIARQYLQYLVIEDAIVLTEEGKLFADGIAADMFVV